MAAYEEAFVSVASKFKIKEFNLHQKTAIRTFIEDERDVFVNLPTGFGKSLVFQALPFIFDFLENQHGHIVVVVSPLLNLIADQVSYLRSVGVKAISISDIECSEDYGEVERGDFQVVYGTPEAWIINERWRTMLSNPTYSSKLCAVVIYGAHVIKQW